MDFHMTTDLPHSPQRVWQVMVDIARIASCIPGCEQIVERGRLESYTAVMKQKIGPFRLEVPAEIVVEEHEEPNRIRARAFGRDKFTGTTLNVVFNVGIAPHAEEGSRLDVNASLQVAGRLASLGHSVIKKRAEENFAQFETSFRARLEAI
jgi:carbon monoxide dehydrogenase subunit G